MAPPQNESGRRRIFIECTQSAFYGGNSGIQRVVRNLANSCRAVGAREGIACKPAFCIGPFWFEAGRVRHGQAPLFAIRAYLVGILLHLWLLLLAIFPIPQLRGLRPRYVRKAIKGLLMLPLLPLAPVFLALYRPVRFRKGDILLLADSSWNRPLWRGVDRARRRGATVGVLVYDLIVLDSPEFFHPELVGTFTPWVGEALQRADFVVAISQHVAGQCRRLAAERLGKALLPVGSFRLGCELDEAGRNKPPRPDLRQLLQGDGAKPYLVVSTIEPRKNHQYVLDAFDRLWAEGMDARLWIIGRKGWLFDDVVRRVESHPRFGQGMRMFHDLTDADLEFCYANARALISASLSEGFGLPIVESLRRRLAVMASDIPVHREAGGAACLYFDLASPGSLAGLVRQRETTGRFPPTGEIDPQAIIPWTESCRQLIRTSLELAGR